MDNKNSAIKSVDIPQSLDAIKELEVFLHKLNDKLASNNLKEGEDLAPYLKKLKLKIPSFMEGTIIEYTRPDDKKRITAKKAVLETRPDKVYADPLAFKIFCIRYRGAVYCLHCGWLYCKIVISY